MSDRQDARIRRAGTESRTDAWHFATSGTYVDRAVSVPVKVAFLIIAFALISVPFVGMLWVRTDTTSENRELASPPPLQKEDGSLNIGILADAGAYFEDRFAYRNEFVSANSNVKQLFETSPTDQVVVGRDGWLYYGGTLPDYLGQAELTERALDNVAHNIGLIRRYVESHGARFVFTIAPNKSTLYPEHMPYYYLKSPSPSNAERLKGRLAKENVNYLDLFELFGRHDGSEGSRAAQDSGADGSVGVREWDGWYLKRDTHWNNKGALVAAEALAQALGRELDGPGFQEAFQRDDFVGDLESMLHPANPRTEGNWYFEGYDDGEGFSGERWSYEEGAHVTDADIVTQSRVPESKGSLLMFRDSFGNALVPFLATGFERATFSKLVPYNVALLAADESDAVVIERAERHLPDLATSASLMPCPILPKESLPTLPEQEDPLGSQTSLVAEKNGPYVVLSGEVDSRLGEEGCRIIVGLGDLDNPGKSDKLYDAFWLSTGGDSGEGSDYGFQVNIAVGKDELADTLAAKRIRVYVVSGETAALAAEFSGTELAGNEDL